VNSQSWPSIHPHELRQIVRDSFSPDKDEHLGILLRDLLEMLEQLAAFVVVGAYFNDLSDIVIGG